MPKRYVFALLIIAVVFFGLIGLGLRALTGGDDKPKQPANAQNQPKPRDFAKETRKVTYTIQGRLVGEEQYRAVRITITPSERTIDLLQGYDEAVVKTQTFANKQSAYDTFLRALDSAGYDAYNKNMNSDERGSCPNGKRYVYAAEFTDNSNLRSWSASCNKAGNFQGNSGIVRSLFEGQIPDYNKFLAGTRLS